MKCLRFRNNHPLNNWFTFFNFSKCNFLTRCKNKFVDVPSWHLKTEGVKNRSSPNCSHAPFSYTLLDSSGVVASQLCSTSVCFQPSTAFHLAWKIEFPHVYPWFDKYEEPGYSKGMRRMHGNRQRSRVDLKAVFNRQRPLLTAYLWH